VREMWTAREVFSQGKDECRKREYSLSQRRAPEDIEEAPFRNVATIFFILAIESDAAVARNTMSLSSGLSITENVVCSTIIRPTCG
jgi:hypothetical protein